MVLVVEEVWRASVEQQVVERGEEECEEMEEEE